ncbi:AAEL013944-PA [Aedes aegypti]|uniref:AAEL013944-PA n=1 Tax=Aedes aegypti TaxID=7159 RepID=Q16HQ4_AEDAE|nr:AAEL013944-PA [Aedes aegypti]
MDPNMLNNPYPPGSYQMQPGGIIQMSGTPDNQNLLTYNIQQPQPISSAANAMNLSSSTVAGTSNPNLMMQNINSKLLTHSQSLPVQNQPNNQKAQPRSISMPTAPNYPPMLAPQQSPPGSILQQHQQDAFKGSLHPQTSSYKSYHSHQPQPYKIPSQNTLSYGSSGRSMRHSSPPHGHQQQGVNLNQQPTIEQSQQQLQDLQLQQQQQQQSSSQSQQKRLPPHPTKEMFRSNSLPINATFPLPPKEENFAVPRYQAKPSPKLRMRSNSMIIKQPGGSSMAPISGANLLPSLHATSSEPVLNMGNSALLAQLLTTNISLCVVKMDECFE